MKFNHKFKLKYANASTRIYCCDDVIARLDFVSNTAMRVALYRADCDMLPTFSVNPENAYYPQGRDRLDLSGFDMYSPEIDSFDDYDEISLGDVKIRVDLQNFLLSCYMGEKLLYCDRAPLAYNIENEFGRGSFHYVSREENERIFGAGDKGGRLDKYGNSYRIETTDCMGYDASSTDPLYKHVPFYMCQNSIGAYGFFYDTSDTSVLDFGREVNNYYAPYKHFKTEDDALVYYVFFGDLLSVVKQFSHLCGKQMLPPKWSFDYCASTMAYTDAPDSDEKMKGFLSKVRELGLSCTGFYLSSGYTSIGNQRYVFNWNTDKFPDPKGFIQRFSDNGIEIIPNIKPAFLAEHPMYDMLAEKGYFIKNTNGTPFVTQFWDGVGSYLDFTNKSAFDFWKNEVTDKLLDYGIRATWNDNNEFDIKDDEAIAVGFGNGLVKASRIRPYLTYLMVEASYQAQMEKYPDLRPFLSTRSGNIGVRRYAQTWSGDNRSEFSDLRYCHYIGLTMSMSGYYFYGHDLGGFHGDMPSRELLLRWLQHGVFEPRFTIHSWNADGSATMPWSYPDIIPSVKRIFAQRRRFVPYLYNCAYNAVQNDEPVNSPLFLYYNDEELSPDSNSFLFGRDILATCIFDEGEDKVSVYLPRNDSWYLGDKLYNGGQTVKLSIPTESEVPVFVRAGSIIPTDDCEYGFNSDEKLVLNIYPIESGSFSAHFFTDDGVSFKYKDNNCVKLDITVECDKDTVTVSFINNGDMDFEPCFKLCDEKKRSLIIK